MDWHQQLHVKADPKGYGFHSPVTLPILVKECSDNFCDDTQFFTKFKLQPFTYQLEITTIDSTGVPQKITTRVTHLYHIQGLYHITVINGNIGI